LFEEPSALAVVSQGITTIVVGQDGGSHVPLRSFLDSLDRAPVAVNVASYSGHGTLRREVLGQDYRRVATPEEVDAMRELLRDDLAAGALGFSTGLEYDPGIYATTEEVIDLAKTTAHAGGRYISHMRSEDRYLLDAIEEILHIGREAQIPVQISHMKLAMRGLWGQAAEVLSRLDDARASGIDVTADVYPYQFWQSTMTVLFPERDFENRETAEFALTQLTSPEGMLIARFDPDTSFVGRTLAEVAAMRGVDATSTYIQLIAESQQLAHELGHGTESIIATSMNPRDITTLLAWSHANVCTDGGLNGRHPRGFGAFPRYFRIMVREEGLLTLEEAVRKATLLAASHLGVVDRGVIRVGAFADLVLFDPDRIADRATPDDPHALSDGVHRVWVNGREVFRQGQATGVNAGSVIRRTVAETGVAP
jgi:N-acyl-D-amino-acid deacylase